MEWKNWGYSSTHRLMRRIIRPNYSQYYNIDIICTFACLHYKLREVVMVELEVTTAIGNGCLDFVPLSTTVHHIQPKSFNASASGYTHVHDYIILNIGVSSSS